MFYGALVNGGKDQGTPVPTRVLHYDGNYASSINWLFGGTQKPNNWFTEGYVVINGQWNGCGQLFALKKIKTMATLYVWTRKRGGTNHGLVGMSNLLSAARIVLTDLGNDYEPTTVVSLLFSNLRSTKRPRTRRMQCCCCVMQTSESVTTISFVASPFWSNVQFYLSLRITLSTRVVSHHDITLLTNHDNTLISNK